MTDDLISRQAVLNILKREGHKWGNDYRDWVDAVNEVETLPPVTLQEPKTNILDRLKEEITNIEISGQVDSHTSFIRTGEQVKDMIIGIIDKYRGENKDADTN